MIGVSLEVSDAKAAGLSRGHITFFDESSNSYSARAMVVPSVTLLIDRLQAWAATKNPILDFEPIDSRNWLTFRRVEGTVEVFGDGRRVGSTDLDALFTELLSASLRLWHCVDHSQSRDDAALSDLETLLRGQHCLPQSPR